MSDQASNAVVHTTLGVSTAGQSGEDEDVIQPMLVSKDTLGKLFCVPSQQQETVKLDEPRKIQDEDRQELANVLAAFSAAPVGTSDVASMQSDGPEVSEDDIVPVSLSRDHQEIILGVLKNWTNPETPEKPSALKKAVAEVIDSQREETVTSQQLTHTMPSNAIVHTTLGVSNTGQDDDLIQPMVVAKDHQGKPICVPSTEILEKRSEEQRHIDDSAKQDLADILMSLTAQPLKLSEPRYTKNDSTTEISEDDIVPTVLSHDQKEVVLNVLKTWGSNDASKKPTALKRAVKDIIVSSQDEDTTDGQHGDVDEDKAIVNDSQSNQEPEPVPDVVKQAMTAVAEESKARKVMNAASFFEKAAIDSAQTLDSEQVALRPKVKPTADVHSAVNIFEKSATEAAQSSDKDQVLLRPKSKQSAGFKAKIDSFQTSHDSPASSSSSAQSTKRPKSMVEVNSTFSAAPGKFEETRKSFTTESKLVPALRPLSSIKPLGSSSSNTSRLGSRPASGAFSSSTFSTRPSRSEYPKSRQDNGDPFQVDVLKGILGLGMKVKVTPEGHVEVTEIQRGGPVDKNGNVRVGDYVLSINSTELTGQTDTRVQQVLRLLPRGLVKIVVSSAAPDGEQGSEPQQYTPDDVQPTLKSVSQDNLDDESPTPMQTYIATENGLELCSAENQSTDSSDLSLPIFTTAESSTNSSQPPLTARIEIMSSGNQQGATPVKIAIKPSPTPRPNHDGTRPKTLPRFAYASNESWETSSEDSTPRDLRPAKSQRSTDNNEAAVQKKSPGVESNSLGNHSRFENSRKMFEEKSVEKTPPPVVHPKPRSHTPVSSEAGLDQDESASPKSQRRSAEAEGLSQTPESQKSKTEEPVKTVESPVKEEIVQSVKSPQQKVPPPVAPKPRVNSTSPNKSDDLVENEEPAAVKPAPKISAGYERLQAISKSNKPSKIIEKSRAYVSSTAKLFDNRPADGSVTSEPPASLRRISVGVTSQIERNKPINVSLKPLSERRKSTGSSLSSTPSPLSPTASPFPTSTPSQPRALRPREISIPETSPRDDESPDGMTKTVLNPTRLNSALSPRRSPSTESSSSPSFSFTPKHAPKIKDSPPSSSFEGKSHTSPTAKERGGFNRSSPVTTFDKKSLSQNTPSHETAPSPHQDKSSRMLSHSNRSQSFPSPAKPLSPSLSSQLSEEALEDTMKKFDDLLMDAPYTRTETDPNDLLLWAPVRKDGPPVSPRKVEAKPDVISKTDVEASRPKAAPRKKPDVKEVKVETREKELRHENEEKDKKDTKAEKTFSVQAMLSDAEDINADNIIACQISGQLMNSNEAKNTDESSNQYSLVDHLNHEADNAHENIVATNLSAQMMAFNQNSPNHENSNATAFSAVDREERAETLRREDENGSSESNTGDEDGEIVDDGPVTADYNHVADKVDEEKNNEALKNKAYQIVEDVLAKVASHPEILQRDEKKAEVADETGSSSSEDEPPPLPGAPPPPLILRDKVMLVPDTDWLDQKTAQAKPEVILQPDQVMQSSTNLLEHSVPPTLIELDVNTDSQEHAPSSVANATDDDHGSRADSVDPLNSTGESVHDGDCFRVNSFSPVDMLSEDSGMPADEEFQEVATDDAISPPGEFAEHDTSPDQAKHNIVPFPTQIQVHLSTTNAELKPNTDSVQNTNTDVIIPEKSSPVSQEMKVNDSNKIVSGTNIVAQNNDQSPPQLPTSSPPCVTSPALHASTAHPDVSSLSQNPMSSVQVSDFLPSSPETISRGDKPSPPSVADQKVEADHSTENHQTDQSSDLVNDSVASRDGTISSSHSNVKDASDRGTAVEEKEVSETPSKPSVVVTSKRKWSLRSSTCKAPVLCGDANVSVPAQFSEKTLVSAVSPADFVSMIDKTNSVLDSMGAPAEMELVVVHLHREGDSMPLGVDLKPTGDAWFQISKVSEGSPVWQDGGVQEGDWLVAVDTLWADQVPMMRLLARLTKPMHDSLIVVASGDRPQDTPAPEPSRPTPAPRPRSLHRQESDDRLMEDKKGKGSEEAEQPPPPVPTTAPPQVPEKSSEKSPPLPKRAPLGPAPTKSAPAPAEPQSEEPPSTTASNSKEPQEELRAGVHKVIMIKGATGVGFCLEGGVGSPKGNLPITIKRIFKGGPAEKCGQLKVTDEILEVNGVDFTMMRHYEAWNHLKFLDDGEVHITIRRNS